MCSLAWEASTHEGPYPPLSFLQGGALLHASARWLNSVHQRDILAALQAHPLKHKGASAAFTTLHATAEELDLPIIAHVAAEAA